MQLPIPAKKNKKMIPQDYMEWRHCIKIDCGINLTPAFAQERIKIMEQNSGAFMSGFRKLYGDHHAQQVLTWFETYLQETQKTRQDAKAL
jgi:hypothetical protein